MYIYSIPYIKNFFSWIFVCLANADKNKDDKLTLSEVKDFFHLINIDVHDDYAELLFKVMHLDCEYC